MKLNFIPKKFSFLSVLMTWLLFLSQFSYGRNLYSEAHLDFNKWERTQKCCSQNGRKIAISSGGRHSSQEGLKIFEMGGNIIDVVVAVAFCLAVERPEALGIGGGGFATLHLPSFKGGSHFVDFRETAPLLSTRNMFLDKKGTPQPEMSLDGIYSVATPGFVAGLYEIHKKWGKLSWETVLKPSVDLAKSGFKVTVALVEDILDRPIIHDDPLLHSIFSKDEKPLKVGDVVIQNDLSKTLLKIAKLGKNPFYQGEIAEDIIRFVKKHGGILREKDLREYEVKWRKPTRNNFQNLEFLSAPPPSAGGIAITQALNIFKDIREEGLSDVDYVHTLTEMLSHIFRNRATYLGDPQFVDVPLKSLLSVDFSRAIQKKINMKNHTKGEHVSPTDIRQKNSHTTHLAVMDDLGNAASVTLSINYLFGSAMMVPGTGIILNDTMDDFTQKAGVKNIYGLVSGKTNLVSPLKRPVSSMTPTIVLSENKPVLVLGGAGGSRIITAVLQVILNYLFNYPSDLKKSIFAPRMHFQWLPDKLELETNGFSENLIESLKSKNHAVHFIQRNALINGVSRNGESLMAVFDPRDEGGASAK